MNEGKATSRIREEFDADSTVAADKYSKIPSSLAKHKIVCSECSDYWFVDDEIFRQVTSASENDATNNPFVCEDCLEEEEFLSRLS